MSAMLCVMPTALAHSGKLTVKRNYSGKYGYADDSGKIVIPYKYDFADGFADGVARVRVKTSFGLIDERGHEVVPMQYSNIYPFRDGLAVVAKDGRSGYIDRTGTIVIPLRYDQCFNFENGAGVVMTDKKYGVVDRTGREVVPCEFDSSQEAMLRYRKSFSYFARDYVEQRIRDWQQKGMYEKTADWRARVNNETRSLKIAELTKEAETIYIERNTEYPSLSIGGYDADNEVYMITSETLGNMLVPVPIAEAENFSKRWNKVRVYPRYFIENDFVAPAEVMFAFPGGKIYKYSNRASLNYTVAQVDYNFDPIEINVADSGEPHAGGSQNISTVNMSVGKSDVDTDIPVTRARNENTFAVIIANENYKRVDNVEFARNDGEIFRRYCVETLGLPQSNVEYYPDATKNDMLAALEWLAGVSKHYNGKANIILYYVGHGIPDEATGDAYLLPSDGIGNNTSTACKLSRIYDALGGMSANMVSVFLDACFSGAQRDGSTLVAARGVALKSKESAPKGNMIVFSAATGTQTAYPYREQQHGLFTYYLLKKLKETNGNATLGELGEYVADEVGRRSIVVNKKEQTPTVTVSPLMATNWKTKRLK